MKTIAYKGQQLSVPQIAAQLGVCKDTIYHRIKFGIPLDQPYKPVVREYRGKRGTLKQLAGDFGVSLQTMSRRLRG